jgi:hypothetical protein
MILNVVAADQIDGEVRPNGGGAPKIIDVTPEPEDDEDNADGVAT